MQKRKLREAIVIDIIDDYNFDGDVDNNSDDDTSDYEEEDDEKSLSLSSSSSATLSSLLSKKEEKENKDTNNEVSSDASTTKKSKFPLPNGATETFLLKNSFLVWTKEKNSSCSRKLSHTQSNGKIYGRIAIPNNRPDKLNEFYNALCTDFENKIPTFVSEMVGEDYDCPVWNFYVDIDLELSKKVCLALGLVTIVESKESKENKEDKEDKNNVPKFKANKDKVKFYVTLLDNIVNKVIRTAAGSSGKGSSSSSSSGGGKQKIEGMVLTANKPKIKTNTIKFGIHIVYKLPSDLKNCLYLRECIIRKILTFDKLTKELELKEDDWRQFVDLSVYQNGLRTPLSKKFITCKPCLAEKKRQKRDKLNQSRMSKISSLLKEENKAKLPSSSSTTTLASTTKETCKCEIDHRYYKLCTFIDENDIRTSAKEFYSQQKKKHIDVINFATIRLPPGTSVTKISKKQFENGKIIEVREEDEKFFATGKKKTAKGSNKHLGNSDEELNIAQFLFKFLPPEAQKQFKVDYVDNKGTIHLYRKKEGYCSFCKRQHETFSWTINCNPNGSITYNCPRPYNQLLHCGGKDLVGMHRIIDLPSELFQLHSSYENKEFKKHEKIEENDDDDVDLDDEDFSHKYNMYYIKKLWLWKKMGHGEFEQAEVLSLAFNHNLVVQKLSDSRSGSSSSSSSGACEKILWNESTKNWEVMASVELYKIIKDLLNKKVFTPVIQSFNSKAKKIKYELTEKMQKTDIEKNSEAKKKLRNETDYLTKQLPFQITENMKRLQDKLESKTMYYDRILHALPSVSGLTDRNRMISANMDMNKDLFAVGNGKVIDFSLIPTTSPVGTIEPSATASTATTTSNVSLASLVRNRRKEDYISLKNDIIFDPEANDPRWKTILDDMFLVSPPVGFSEITDPKVLEEIKSLQELGKKKQQTLQEWCGYCLTGYTNMEAFMTFYNFLGRGGKSSITEALFQIMGEYATPVKAEMFYDKGGDKAEAASPFLVDLKKKRLGVIDEFDETKKLNPFFKSSTAGAKQKGRGMYGLAEEIDLLAKFIFNLNRWFDTRSWENSKWERTWLISFPAYFGKVTEKSKLNKIKHRPVNETLKNLIRTDIKLKQTILNWALHGAIRFYQNNKKFIIPNFMKEDLKKFQVIFDSYAQWKMMWIELPRLPRSLTITRSASDSGFNATNTVLPTGTTITAVESTTTTSTSSSDKINKSTSSTAVSTTSSTSTAKKNNKESKESKEAKKNVIEINDDDYDELTIERAYKSYKSFAEDHMTKYNQEKRANIPIMHQSFYTFKKQEFESCLENDEESQFDGEFKNKVIVGWKLRKDPLECNMFQ